MFRKDIIINKLQQDLLIGLRIAADSSNNALPNLSLLKTTFKSEWHSHECPICNDTFRENDFVRKCPSCNQAYHDDPVFNLFCWGAHFSVGTQCVTCNNYCWNGWLPPEAKSIYAEARRIATVEKQFFAGLTKTWEVFGDEEIYIIGPGDFMVGNICPMCPYKLRVGDRVVKCPCSPQCPVYFHNDVPRNWACWNEWNGEQGKNYCPLSSRKYAPKSRFKMIYY